MAKISSPSLVDTGQDPGLSYFKTTQENVHASSKPGFSTAGTNENILIGSRPTPDVTNQWLYEAAISSPSVIDEPSGVAVTPTRPIKSSTSTPPSYIIGPQGNVQYVTEVVNNFINNFIPPAGRTHEIQINENGALYGDPELTFNPITDTLTTETIRAKYVSGGLLTNAQPNITSVGTLDHLNVTDSVVANGFYYSNGMPIGGVIGDFNRGVYFGAESISNNVSLVDTFPLNGNTAVRWTTSSFDAINSKYKTSTIDSLNDGANIYHNEYSVIRTDETAAVIQFTSNISLGNINLWAVGDSPQVQVTFERTVLGSSTNIGYLTAGPRGAQGLPGNGSWNGGVVTNLIRVTNTTDSVSTNTGAVVISGGLGVVGNVNVKNISANGFYYANGISIVPDLTTYASKAYVNTAISSNLANYTTKSYVDGKLANVTWANLVGKPTLANIATSGSYLDLSNTPTIPSLAGYATETYVSNAIRNISIANIGDLASTGYVANAIANIVIPNTDWPNISNKPSFSNVATSGSYTDLTNKPTLFSGSYTDLTNKPTLFSGSYTDLTSKPTIPTSFSSLVNGANTFSLGSTGTVTFPNGALTVTGNKIRNVSEVEGLYAGSELEVSLSKTVITNGVTNSLGEGGPSLTSQFLFEVNSNKILSSFQVINSLSGGDPTLINERITELNSNGFQVGLRVTNDLGSGTPVTTFSGWTFGTVNQQQVLTFPDDTVQTTAWTGVADYNSLSNIPTIPTHTSNLTNDSGFITISDVPSAKELSFDIKSTNFSADSGSRYGVNTTLGPVTCTLPSSPTTGDAILFVDVGVSFGTFGLTLDGNGNDIRYVVNDNSNSEPTLVVANSYTIEKSDYLAGSLGPRSWGILWTGSVWTGY